MKKSVVVILVIAFLAGIVSFVFDSQIADFSRAIQNPVLYCLFIIFKPLSTAILSVLIIALILFKDRFKKWTLPLALTLAISMAVSVILKFIFMRPRPFGLIETLPFINLIDYSFPSSHAIIAFSSLPILNKEFPKFKYLWIVLACLVALSRLYFGVHYASDIIFGSIIGYLIGYSAVIITEKYSNKKR